MGTMKMGQYIGPQDQLSHDIHVGDLLKDAKGAEYTVDRFHAEDGTARSWWQCEVEIIET